MTDTLTLIEPDPAKRLLVIVAGLRDYAENPTQHLLSDISGWADSLEVTANDVNQKLSQARRTAGGLQAKAQSQRAELRALEDHLEVMEEETSGLREEVTSLNESLKASLITLNQARAELGLEPRENV